MDSQTQLLGKNTHFSPNAVLTAPQPQRWCWNKRRCYRDLECDYCWNRRRKFITDQLKVFGMRWPLRHFHTLSFVGYCGSPENALKNLLKVRSDVHENFLKDQKYFSTAVVHGSLGHQTPHFHILSSRKLPIKKELLRELTKHFDLNTSLNLNSKPITRTPESFAGLSRYLLDHNVRVSLAYRPRGARLITSSKGIYTGRPRILPNLFDQEIEYAPE